MQVLIFIAKCIDCINNKISNIFSQNIIDIRYLMNYQLEFFQIPQIIPDIKLNIQQSKFTCISMYFYETEWINDVLTCFYERQFFISFLCFCTSREPKVMTVLCPRLKFQDVHIVNSIGRERVHVYGAKGRFASSLSRQIQSFLAQRTSMLTVHYKRFGFSKFREHNPPLSRLSDPLCLILWELSL